MKNKKSEKRDKYSELALIKLWNIMVTMIAIVIGALETISRGLVKGFDRIRHRRTERNHPDYRTIKIC